MNDDIYNMYCDDRCYNDADRLIYKYVIIHSMDYLYYETQIAIDELKQALHDALPTWLQRFFKGWTK